MKKRLLVNPVIIRLMRISFIQTFLAVIFTGVSLAHSSSAQELLHRKINLQVENEHIRKVLTEIERQAPVKFAYRPRTLPPGKKITLSIVNEPLINVLEKVTQPYGIRYEVIGQQIILQSLKPETSFPGEPHLLPPLPSLFIDKTISGRVTDEKGEGLPGVNILIKGTQQGTTTDADGLFRLTVRGNDDILVFSFVGYVTQEVIVGTMTSFDISMKEDEKSLEEVVVVGYGTVKRRDLTGAVSSVSGNTLKDIPVTSAAQALVGRMPGVQVTKTDGSPDADIKIRIRGGGSITQDNSPLFLVDGFPIGSINDISPADILSIDVLKDASSTAIYGARGANGVVIITTKGGKEGKGKVSYNMFYGQKKITRYLDVLDPYEYAFWQYEIQDDRDAYRLRFGDFNDMHLYKQMTGTNWQKEIFGQAGSSLSNNLSLSGGSSASRYNISLTHNKEEEIMIESGYRRTNLTITTNNRLNDWLSVDLNTRLVDKRLKGAGTVANERLAHVIQFRPAEGYSEFVDELAAEEDFSIPSTYTVNPYKQTLDDYRRQNALSINFNGAVNIRLPKELSYRAEFGYSYDRSINDRFYGLNTYNAMVTGFQPLASIQSGNSNSYRIANVLTYVKNDFLPGSNLNVVAGQELNYSKGNSILSSVRYLPAYIDAVSALNMMQLGMADPISTSDSPAITLSSYFGRLNYDYKGKYLLSATLRADGSSMFAPGNQWGYFPSAAAAWRISDEGFFEDARPFVDDLKMRVSYGVSGNNRIPANAWQKTLSVNTGRLFIEGNENTPTAFLVPNSTLSNRKLKWESTVTRNVGVDFSLLKYRLTGTIEVYKNTTRDLLIMATVPSSTGYTNQFQNIGQTSNRGLELTLDAVMVEKKDFRFSAAFNIGFNRNRIDKLGETKRWEQSALGGSDGATGDYLIEEGGKVGLMYGYETDGNGMYSFDDFSYENGSYILKEGVADNRTLISAKWFRPGALKFVDQNGDHKVDAANDKVVIGDANPKHSGGINLTAQFKGLDLSAFFNWVYGNNIYNANKLYFTNYWGTRLYKNILGMMNSEDRFINVSPVTGQVVTDPAELREMNKNAKYWSAAMDRAPLHSWVIEDGSFLRLNNLTLGYSLPRDLLSKWKFEQLRVYVTGYNLAIWTKYTGYDPEVDAIRNTALTPGMDYNAYPRSRSWNVGLNLTF